MNALLHDTLRHHYARDDLLDTLQRVLDSQAGGVETIPAHHWAALDEFHVRGADATRSLAGLLELTPGSQVLDLGCGLGGAARYLAREYGCQVLGVDLTADYCRVGQWLNGHLGLSSQVQICQADASRAPFADASFDVVWTQHTAMNIPDKSAFYAGIRRMLRSTGRLAIYDVLAGDGGAPRYPVPWARDASQSFLLGSHDLSTHLIEAGFTVSHWRDVSAEGLAWFERQAARAATGPRALGLQLLLGKEFPQMVANLRTNLAERRVILLEAVARPC